MEKHENLEDWWNLLTLHSTMKALFSDMFSHGDRTALVVSSCKVGNVYFQCVKQYFSVIPHRVHVWYIFLYLSYKLIKCR